MSTPATHGETKTPLLHQESQDNFKVSAANTSTTTKSWLRLAAVFLIAVVSGGIIPGQAIFNQLFAESGLFHNLCSEHESTCDAQFLVIANIMNSLSIVC